MATKPTGGGGDKPTEAAAAPAAAPAAAGDLLGAVIAESQKAGARDQLKALLERAISSGVSEGAADKKKTIRNAIQLIEGQIKTLDQRLSLQLNEILHNQRFQTLEATWRGMK